MLAIDSNVTLEMTPNSKDNPLLAVSRTPDSIVHIIVLIMLPVCLQSHCWEIVSRGRSETTHLYI